MCVQRHFLFMDCYLLTEAFNPRLLYLVSILFFLSFFKYINVRTGLLVRICLCLAFYFFLVYINQPYDSFFFFFEREFQYMSSWALYHQTKTPINFWCKRRLNLRSLIQLSKTLPIELTGTHDLMTLLLTINCGNFFIDYYLDPPLILFFYLLITISKAKMLVVELAFSHIQSAWRSMEERIRTVGLAACYNYFSKK